MSTYTPDKAWEMVVQLDFWPSRAHEDIEAKSLARLEDLRRRGQVPWLVDMRYDECVVDLDELRAFIVRHFPQRVDVASTNLFQNLRNRVRLDVGYHGHGTFNPSTGRDMMYFAIDMPICYYHLRGGQLPILTPLEIENSLKQYRADVVDYRGSAFVMMRFAGTPLHLQILEAVRSTLERHRIVAVTADAKQYHDELFYNVLTYLHGCNFGVAIFERLESDEFNPNVSLEVGYLMALGKPVCFLKDSTLKALHTDLTGKLYRAFNPQEVDTSVPRAVGAWLRDKNLLADREKVHQKLANANEGDLDTTPLPNKRRETANQGGRADGNR